MVGGGTALGIRGGLVRKPRASGDAAVRGVVAPVPALRNHSWRPASRQLFRRRGGRGRGAPDRGGQSLRLWLRADFSAALRQRRRRTLSGAEDQRRGSRRPRL